jgi:hypothetical protein
LLIYLHQQFGVNALVELLKTTYLAVQLYQHFEVRIRAAKHLPYPAESTNEGCYFAKLLGYQVSRQVQSC